MPSKVYDFEFHPRSKNAKYKDRSLDIPKRKYKGNSADILQIIGITATRVTTDASAKVAFAGFKNAEWEQNIIDNEDANAHK